MKWWLLGLSFEVVIFYYHNHNVNKDVFLVKAVITITNNLKCCYDIEQLLVTNV